jgi:hypothetical protein
MPILDDQNTVNTLLALSQKEGGDLHFENKVSLNSFSNWATATTIPADFIPFSISIYDTELCEDTISLTLMVNPKDLYVSQSQVTDSAYSRAGWINTLWGNQQGLLTASGMTAGFYYMTPQESGGLTNFYRRNSIAYLNLLSIVSLFKNNGYYFMDGTENPTLFKDGTSRVINVMDTIRISYDGSDFLGSFSSFSINDVATNPYRLDYNLEFNISSFGTDLQGIEGHVKKEGNDAVNKIQISVQGSNTRFDHTVLLSSVELNKHFKNNPEPSKADQLRGGAQYKVKNVSNLSTLKQVALASYLKANPKIDAKVAVIAKKIGMTKEQLASIIQFESAGTWDPTVNNSGSSALGIGQWTDDAAIEMAKVLAKAPYNMFTDPSVIKTSRDLLAIFDTTEKQLDLFVVYTQATHVKGGTLQQVMDRQPNPDEKFKVYMTGHFRPKSVGLPYDTPLPDDVQAVNPNIHTMNDYFRGVDKEVVKASSKQVTIAKSE